MKILITGVHGFVGSNLSATLAPNHTVYGLDIISPENPNVAKTYSWEDLDAGRVPQVDAVVHLAAMVHDVKNITNEEAYYAINTGLTKKIYDWFLGSGAGKFVFFSTVKAAADSVEGVLTEDVVPSPVGPYGNSKLQAEAYIMGHPAADRMVYILRPCMIHGSGNKGNLPLLFNMVRKGIPWPLGAYENLRTFTSIGNVCFVVEGLLTREIPSGIYNMGDDDPVSTNRLIHLICTSLGRKARIWRVPKWFIAAGAWLGGLLHLPLNPERLRKLTENYVSSNAKLKAALGIEHMPISCEQGLAKTFEAFRNE
ncbi:MAG: NAD-dependent epimerase/dehydratase family protein [Bacteroidales bacterium]|nr:NAD-dependent epimerase/dehydratase family protein [Bacteroidales bacterium]